MQVATLGVDLAKNVFQLCGVDSKGEVVLRRRLSRDQLAELTAALKPCTIAIEACPSAHHWAREFIKQGHRVKMISPQFVKPFVKGNKNDGNDAQAIVEAAERPTMRFVPVKTVEQQDIQSLHRVRSRLVNNRTGLVSQMRGILAERGIVFPKSITRARREIPRIVADFSRDLSGIARELLRDLLEQLGELDRRIALMDRRLESVFRASEPCQRLAKISGVGPMTATAMVAAIGDGSDFKNGRHLAAWLGLVPRQHSSGDRQRLYGISKRGDKHLRTMLIHGARAVVRIAPTKNDYRHQWVQAVRERRGVNRTIVAVANKNARIIWSILAKNEHYRASH